MLALNRGVLRDSVSTELYTLQQDVSLDCDVSGDYIHTLCWKIRAPYSTVIIYITVRICISCSNDHSKKLITAPLIYRVPTLASLTPIIIYLIWDEVLGLIYMLWFSEPAQWWLQVVYSYMHSYFAKSLVSTEHAWEQWEVEFLIFLQLVIGIDILTCSRIHIGVEIISMQI